MRIAVVLVLVSLGVGSPAFAEIYKCQGPDGDTLYTTDRSQCPGAEAHDLKGQIQSVESSRSVTSRRASRPARRARAGSPDIEATQRAHWQAKKREAQATLAESQERLRYLERMVTACNRGAELWVEDADTGIRQGYSCNRVKAERAEVATLVTQAEHFLAEGLEEQCRRAGCLPGWIR